MYNLIIHNDDLSIRKLALQGFFNIFIVFF